MTTDAIYEERRSHWSLQVSAMAITRWLQCDQTLPLSAKGVACETIDQLMISHTVYNAPKTPGYSTHDFSQFFSRDQVRQYCEEKLMPRVLLANREERK